MRRIEESAPPASTFEGQLHRLRVARAEQKASDGSWWATAPREGFADQAALEAERMRHSTGARLVDQMQRPRSQNDTPFQES